MTDMLIRDVPDDVITALDAHARRLGLSRSEYAASSPKMWLSPTPPSAPRT